MMKKKIIEIALIAGTASLMLMSFLFSSPEPVPVRVGYIDAEYVADFSDDAVLIGASQNVFVGKVIDQIGAKERGIGPETQFQVEVVENIKGNLKGTVELDQRGGYKNGTLYVIDDDVSTPNQNEYLLKPGSTYLFATRYNPTENWYTLNPYPTASKLISSDSSLNIGQLKALAAQDERVQQLRAAYPHEKLLDADIKHGNTPNSYVSVQAAAANQTQ